MWYVVAMAGIGLQVRSRPDLGKEAACLIPVHALALLAHLLAPLNLLRIDLLPVLKVRHPPLLQVHGRPQGPRRKPSRASTLVEDRRLGARRNDAEAHPFLLQGRLGVLQVLVFEPNLRERHGLLS